MGFKDGLEIVRNLNTFIERVLNAREVPAPRFFYDFAVATTPDLTVEQRAFDVVLCDLSLMLFKLASKAVLGSDVLANLQRMVREDAVELGTSTHIFCLDISPYVWTAKRVTQVERQNDRQKSENGAAYGDTVTLCSVRGAPKVQVPVECYVFGLDTPMPDSVPSMKSTPRLFAKFCVFLGDLVANHLRAPIEGRAHTIVMSGFRSSTLKGQDDVYHEVTNRFEAWAVLDEYENTIADFYAEEDAKVRLHTPVRATANSNSTAAAIDAAVRHLFATSALIIPQETRVVHVVAENLKRTTAPAVHIGEAEAQMLYYVRKIEREESEHKAFLLRTEDTDILALSLLTMARLAEKLADTVAGSASPATASAEAATATASVASTKEFLKHRLWLDLENRGVKRFVDVVQLWRTMHLLEETLAKRRTGHARCGNVIEWLVLAMDLTANDYCERMPHFTSHGMFKSFDHLLDLVAHRQRRPLSLAARSCDMVLDETLMLLFVLRVYANENKEVEKFVQSLRLNGKLSDDESLRVKFDEMSSRFKRKPKLASGRESPAFWTQTHNEMRAHMRRAAACLHYQLNVTSADYELLDAYACGEDNESLFGYRSWQQQRLSATHGFSPEPKTYFEYARRVTPLSLTFPFVRTMEPIASALPLPLEKRAVKEENGANGKSNGHALHPTIDWNGTRSSSAGPRQPPPPPLFVPRRSRSPTRYIPKAPSHVVTSDRRAHQIHLEERQRRLPSAPSPPPPPPPLSTHTNHSNSKRKLDNRAEEIDDDYEDEERHKNGTNGVHRNGTATRMLTSSLPVVVIKRPKLTDEPTTVATGKTLSNESESLEEFEPWTQPPNGLVQRCTSGSAEFGSFIGVLKTSST